MNFAQHGANYQEFLKERSNRGIYDLIHLGMIPRINVYPLTLSPQTSTRTHGKTNIEAILLSHAHLDHRGNIGLLHRDIPVVASATSAAILKAMRDYAPTSLGGEMSYYSPKTRIPKCGGLVGQYINVR